MISDRKKALPAPLLLSVAVWMSTAPAAAAEVSGADWNTSAFFSRARAADVSACLEAGAEVDARDEDGETPLHQAAENGQAPAVLEALLKAGAKINARDEDGWPPLHKAAFSDAPAAAQILLKAGADPAARSEGGSTPWDYVKENNALKGMSVYWWLKEERFR